MELDFFKTYKTNRSEIPTVRKPIVLIGSQYTFETKRSQNPEKEMSRIFLYSRFELEMTSMILDSFSSVMIFRRLKYVNVIFVILESSDRDKSPEISHTRDRMKLRFL